MKNKIILKAGAGCTPISLENALLLFGQSTIDAGELRLETKHYGPWSIILSCKGIAVTATWKDIGITYNVVDEYTIHGFRTTNKVKESGYDLEGYVSVDGKKLSCFTSSILFEIEETKKLISVGCLHCRTPKKEGEK
jgi:hypothetical protein